MQITGRLVYAKKLRMLSGTTRTRIILKSAKVSGFDKKLYGYHYQLTDGLFWNSQVCLIVFRDDSPATIKKYRDYMISMFKPT